MADNISITAGSGTDVATDDIASVHYQKVKIALGADNALDTLVDSGQQTMANSVPVVLASDHTDTKITLDGEAVVLGAGTAAFGKLAANSGVDIGDVDITSIAAGDNNIGNVDVLTIAAGTTLIGDVGIQPRTTNGLDVLNSSSSDGGTALTNSAQAIKASAGKVYGWAIYNPNTSAAFVQLYNTASGSVTVGTTSPLFMLTIPPGTAAHVINDIGITFGTAISWAATSTAGGNGAPTTALDAVAFYK